LFARDEEGLKRLAWDSFCAVNLNRYLLEDLKEHEKVGVLVRGRDARAFNRLLQDNMVKREQVILYGLPCPGMLYYDLLVKEAKTASQGIAEKTAS